MGSAIRFQKLWATGVDYRRTRGFRATVSVIEFLAQDLPDGFNFTPPKAQEICAERWPKPAGLEAIARARGGNSKGLVAQDLKPQRRLGFVGALALATIDDDGKSYLVEVAPLFVQRLETVRDVGGAVVVLRAYVADLRWLFARGGMPKWSFNRQRGDGSVAKDSLDPKGNAYLTKGVVAEQVLPYLPGRPKLGQFPARWSGAPPWDFGTQPQALEALSKVVSETNTTEPCLNLDNSLSFYDMGSGRVGYAPKGKGSKNTIDFPAGLRPVGGGADQGHMLELTYRPDFVRVTGGPRIATAVLDHCDPVLIDEAGNVVLMDEEAIRRLTGDRFGLGWLRNVILQPGVIKAVPGLDERVARMISEQAFRLWRIPGVEVPSLLKELKVDPETGQQVLSERTVPAPGPNAHVLPLLPLAELSGGKRMPITLHSYSFHQVHYLYRSDLDPAQIEWHDVIGELQQLRFDIDEFVRGRNRTVGEVLAGSDAQNPFNMQTFTNGGVHQWLMSAEVRAIVLRADPERVLHVSHAELVELVSQARLLERIKKLASPEMAQAYQKALTKLYALGEQSVTGMKTGTPSGQQGPFWDASLEGEFDGQPGRSDLWKAALAIVKVEAELNKRRNAVTEDVLEELTESPDLQVDLVQAIVPLVKAVNQKRLEARRLDGTGAVPGVKRQPPVYGHENLGRSVDPTATVFDADKGIVRVERLPGHLGSEDVEFLVDTFFTPMPVAIAFGTRIRPRTDVPVGTPLPKPIRAGGTRTREQEAQQVFRDGGSYVPEALTDMESNYESVWKRGGSAVERVDVRKLKGEALAKVLRHSARVRKPELVELIPHPDNGKGNAAELDKQAKLLAEAQVQGVDVIKAESITLLHPWPVNCDGLVAGVQIVGRAGGHGFETRIETGGSAPRIDPMKTRERPVLRERVTPDSAAREGL